MLPRIFKFRIIIAACLVILSIVIITTRGKQYQEIPFEPEVEKADIVFLTGEPTIKFKKVYSLCGHVETWEEKVIFPFPVTQEIIAHLYSDWTVVEFSSNGALLKQTIEDYCEDHYFVGISDDGYISLYKGTPEKYKLIEKSDIIVSDLRKEDVLQLEKGIIIKDYQEFKDICQDLSG